MYQPRAKHSDHSLYTLHVFIFQDQNAKMVQLFNCNIMIYILIYMNFSVAAATLTSFYLSSTKTNLATTVIKGNRMR